MTRYFYHKIEIIRVFINSIAIGIGHTRSTKRYNAILINTRTLYHGLSTTGLRTETRSEHN